MSDLNASMAAALQSFMEDADISQMDVVRRLISQGAERGSKSYVSDRLSAKRPLSNDITAAVAEIAGLTPIQMMHRLTEKMVEQRRGSQPAPRSAPKTWQELLAEEFRRAHVRQPQLGLGDILPGRPRLAQRALDGDPTLDDATLKLVALGLGINPAVVRELKESTTTEEPGASVASVS